MKKRRIAYVLAAAVTLALGSGVVFFSTQKPRQTIPLPTAVQALLHVVPTVQQPVSAELMQTNPYRLQAGLRPVATDWKELQCGLRIMDGPSITILADASGVPAKVILTGTGWSRDYRVIEYDVMDGKLNGPATTWVEAPGRLLEKESYVDNLLHGPVVYYSRAGDEICRCCFYRGQPWTGRTLERAGDWEIGLDVSYRDGKLHGTSIRYENGRIHSLETYSGGVLHGPERQYHEGALRSERIYEQGKCKISWSWYPDGQLEAICDSGEGRRYTGRRRGWDRSGKLIHDDTWLKGKRHGRCYPGPTNEYGWYWESSFIGSGEEGQAAFEQRQGNK